MTDKHFYNAIIELFTELKSLVISKTCANSFFYRFFVYAAPTLWNALDLDIRLLPFDTFKKVLRHIFI